MNLIARLFKKTNIHIHCFNTPILSQYQTFGSRKIVYQCECGKKELRAVHRSFSEPFPVETLSLITNKDIQVILDNPNVLPVLNFSKMLELIY